MASAAALKLPCLRHGLIFALACAFPAGAGAQSSSLCDDIKRAVEMAPASFTDLRLSSQPSLPNIFDAKKIAGAQSCYISLRRDPRYNCSMTATRVTKNQVPGIYKRQTENVQKCFSGQLPSKRFGDANASLASTTWNAAPRATVTVSMSRGDGMSKVVDVGASFEFNSVSIEIEYRQAGR